MRLVLLLGILLYVGVVEMAYMGGYLEATRVVGAVRFSLQHPEHGSDCQSTLCGEQYLTKAMATEDNCTNDFAPLDTLAYCEQSHHQQAHQVSVMNDENTMDTRILVDDNSSIYSVSASDYKGSVLPCQIYEAINAQVMRESSMVVWTRATAKNQTLVCGSGEENTCPQTYETVDRDDGSDSNSNQPFYIAQSEAFTLF